MKVKEIIPPSRSEKTMLAAMLMQQHRFNDPLFESIAFKITVEINHPSLAFHRLYWENCCTKTGFADAPLSADGKTLVMRCSLSECIQLIQKCTPPRFQTRLTQEMVTIEDVTDLLKMYLTDPQTGYLEYYNSLFTKVMHLEYTDTGFRPNLEKISVMMHYHKHDNEFTLIVDASTVSLDEIMTHSVIEHGAIQLTMQAYHEKECVDMYHFIAKTPLLIDKVYTDTKYGICVSCYATEITEEMIRKIRACYKPIMK